MDSVHSFPDDLFMRVGGIPSERFAKFFAQRCAAKAQPSAECGTDIAAPRFRYEPCISHSTRESGALTVIDERERN
jgi:hypothetical protein